MTKILCIETGTDICSVALSVDGNAVDELNSTEPQAHARKLAVLIDEILKKNELTASQLDAVAISEGPGSYTGLRIGTSTAKGICYGAKIPLIAVGSLDALAHAAVHMSGINSNALFCSMIDARRMEVYTALYNGDGKRVKEVEALVVDSNSFAEMLQSNIIYFFGDGAAKCANEITSSNARFIEVASSAANMARLAYQKFEEGAFADVAYFEPFYLKDFVVTKSKKNLLGL